MPCPPGSTPEPCGGGWDLRNGFEIGAEEVRLVALGLAVLDGGVIQKRVELYCLVGCCAILVLYRGKGWVGAKGDSHEVLI